VPAGGVTMIFGPPSCGKSTLLWTMADEIYRGGMFLGTYQTKKGKVLFVNVDMPAFSIAGRMNNAKYVPLFDICDFPNHFNITQLKEKDPIEYSNLQRLGIDYQVIMIDALSNITTGLSMKDDWVPGLVISTLRELFPTQSVVLLHHSRKQVMSPFGPVAPHREDALGSNFWMSMVQSQIQMSLRGKHLAHLELTKSQVVELEDGIDLYVDDTGCAVSLYTTTNNSQWQAALARAEQSALAMNPLYKSKSVRDRQAIIGTLLTPPCGYKTVQRWISRTAYKMIT